MQTDDKKCSNGINSLQDKGLKPIVDENLQITFNDPVGLYSDLCKVQHRCAFQGIFDPKRNYRNKEMPTLYIDDKDMGTLENLKVQEIKELAQPSPFGLGSKTVYDENVRKALEIKGDRIKLDMMCPYEIQKMAPMGHQIEAKLYKLAIYEQDGFFAEHADTLHADNHLGTLVVCLPIPHEGGALILCDDENELRLPFDELIKDGQIPWVAFYTDVKHKVEVVKSGMRMTLQFDLLAQKSKYYNGTLRTKLQPDRLRAEPESIYHFQDYNQEILSSILDKINTVFSKPKSQPVEEKDKEIESSKPTESKTESSMSDNPKKSIFDNRPTESKAASSLFDNSKKSVFDNSAKAQRSTLATKSRREEKAKIEEDIVENPDGIAIMLKRRYGAMSLSPEMLKGSDGVLYHALKDHFMVEVKQIILEQHEGYEGGYGRTPNQIVALSEIRELPYSSDEETELGQNNKHIPKKHQKFTNKNEESKEIEDKPQENAKEKVKKNVCLVAGFSAKYLSRLASHGYHEFTGNEALPAIYSYLHAALFVYPKANSEVLTNK